MVEPRVQSRWIPKLIVNAAYTPPAQSHVTGRTSELLIALLRRPHGASLAMLCEVSGWRRASVRAWLSRLKRRGRGRLVVEHGTLSGKVYKLMPVRLIT